MILANEKWFQGLPADLRHILLTGAKMGAVAENGKRMFEARVTMVDAPAQEGHGSVRADPGRSGDVPQSEPGAGVGVAGKAARRREGFDRWAIKAVKDAETANCSRGESGEVAPPT